VEQFGYEVGSPHRGVQRLDSARGRRRAAACREPREDSVRRAATASPDSVADAYAQFLLGHRFEENEDETSAIAAYKRAMELDPKSAEIPAQLAGLYLEQSKVQEAMAAAEAALKIAPTNREANRVLGTIYAALSESTSDPAARGAAPSRPTPTSPRRFTISSSRSKAPSPSPIRTCAPRSRGSTSQRRVRQGDSAADRSREPGARLAGRSADARGGVRRGRAQPRRDRVARGADGDDPRCCRRSPISTSASGAGPTPPALRARAAARAAQRDDSRRATPRR
jgi:tetratricopeptide (TPR) repeat protein